ncbi:MAG: copper amine oxidase N-terminal domain-containing protein [Oscillospiraceae bacterium]|nr:copper amine oxidase N-terminal domain-containing protein [Oscillospiraceae bacterium]
MKKKIVFISVLISVLFLAFSGASVYAAGQTKAYDEGYATGYADGFAGRDYDAEQGPQMGSENWFDYFSGYSDGYSDGHIDGLKKNSSARDENVSNSEYLARFDKVKSGPKDNWGYDEWKLWLDYLYEQWMYYAPDDQMLDALAVYMEAKQLYETWFESLPAEEYLRIRQEETEKILEEIEILNEIQRIADEKAAAAAKAAAAEHAAKPITLKIDGKVISTDVAPVIEDGRTLAPMRAVVEALGYLVTWDSGTQTVNIYSYATDVLMISLKIGSNKAKVFTPIPDVMDERVLDVPAKLINGRTMIPVRFIAETLGCTVKWDPDNKIVEIISAMG